MEVANDSSAGVLQQEQYKHQWRHAAIANQDERTQNCHDDVSEAEERPERDEVLCGGSREGVESDSVRLGHDIGAFDDGFHADDGLDEYEEADQPQRDLSAAICIVDGPRKDV